MALFYCPKCKIHHLRGTKIAKAHKFYDKGILVETYTTQSTAQKGATRLKQQYPREKITIRQVEGEWGVFI